MIDIGVNLLDSYHEPDVEQVLQRARHIGVEKMIVTAGTLQESRDAFELVQGYGKQRENSR